MLKVLTILLMLGSSAWAQQQDTPYDQALKQKILEEVGNNIALKAQIIQLQEELAKAKDPPKEKDDAEHK